MPHPTNSARSLPYAPRLHWLGMAPILIALAMGGLTVAGLSGSLHLSVSVLVALGICISFGTAGTFALVPLLFPERPGTAAGFIGGVSTAAGIVYPLIFASGSTIRAGYLTTALVQFVPFIAFYFWTARPLPSEAGCSGQRSRPAFDVSPHLLYDRLQRGPATEPVDSGERNLARLLVVEDNDKLAHLLVQRLVDADYVVDRVSTMADAGDVLSRNQYALIILDLGLPDGNALTLLRSLRARDNPTPVLILTAMGGIQHKVEGLGAGADDYLVKPFAFEELQARVLALLRRPSGFLGKPLELGNLSFDVPARQVYVDGRPEVFSARELAILEALMERCDRVVTKSAMLDRVFGLSEEARANAIEVYVHRLRKHLHELGARVDVHTVRGVGYLIREILE